MFSFCIEKIHYFKCLRFLPFQLRCLVSSNTTARLHLIIRSPPAIRCYIHQSGLLKIIVPQLENIVCNTHQDTRIYEQIYVFLLVSKGLCSRRLSVWCVVASQLWFVNVIDNPFLWSRFLWFSSFLVFELWGASCAYSKLEKIDSLKFINGFSCNIISNIGTQYVFS